MRFPPMPLQPADVDGRALCDKNLSCRQVLKPSRCAHANNGRHIQLSIDPGITQPIESARIEIIITDDAMQSRVPRPHSDPHVVGRVEAQLGTSANATGRTICDSEMQSTMPRCWHWALIFLAWHTGVHKLTRRFDHASSLRDSGRKEPGNPEMVCLFAELRTVE